MRPVYDTKTDLPGADRPVRVAVVVHHPAQYFAPAQRALAAVASVEARVFYWDAATDGVTDAHGFGRHIRWSTDLHSGYDWCAPQPGRPAWIRLWTVWRALRRYRPQVLLCFGWGCAVARLGIGFGLANRVPIVYYGDTNGYHPANARRGSPRHAVLRRLFRHAGGAVCVGAANRAFYLFHGMDSDRIHPGVLPADVEPFAVAGRERPEFAMRPLVFGFAGKFMAIKAVDDLIAATCLLPRDRDRDWRLVLIGDGPLREELTSRVRGSAIADRVRFLGFRNANEMPALLATVDVMVLPSRREARGLAAVEAMAAGAAMVVSSATGVWGPGDIVEHGRTGLVYPVGDVEALAGCLRDLMDDPALRARLAAGGRARAVACGPREFANSTASALVSIVRGRDDAHIG